MTFVDLKPGARFQLSALGAERCPKKPSRIGTIVNVNRTRSIVRVQFDDAKATQSIHRSYIEPIPDIDRLFGDDLNSVERAPAG